MNHRLPNNANGDMPNQLKRTEAELKWGDDRIRVPVMELKDLRIQ
jgi:hypothetical protein